MSRVNNENGSAATEVAVLLALVAVVSISGISGLSELVSNKIFTAQASSVIESSATIAGTDNDTGLTNDETSSGGSGNYGGTRSDKGRVQIPVSSDDTTITPGGFGV